MATAKDSALLPGYVAIGTDELKMSRVLDRMDARLQSCGGDLDFDRDVFLGEKVDDPALLRSSLDTLPFGSDFRLVVVKGVDKASKPVTEGLISYFQNPSPSTVVMMTASKLATSTRLYKALAAFGEKAIIDCSPKKRKELPAQVIEMAKARGNVLDYEGADAMVRLLGESTVLIDNELAKLSCAYPHARIGRREVEALVSRVSELKPWDFTDAVGRRDVAVALKVYGQLGQKETFGVFQQTVALLRELICAKCLVARGETGRLSEEVGKLRGKSVQGWQVKNHLAWARNYTLGELEHALITAPQCEAQLKSSMDVDVAFTTWILSFCR